MRNEQLACRAIQSGNLAEVRDYLDWVEMNSRAAEACWTAKKTPQPAPPRRRRAFFGAGLLGLLRRSTTE